MRDLVRLIVWMVVDLIRSRAALEAEIWMLRQQIEVLRRTASKRQTFSAIDRLILVCLIGFSLAFAMRWRFLGSNGPIFRAASSPMRQLGAPNVSPSVRTASR